MRQKLLRSGADELSYEIRSIVRKAEFLKLSGKTIYWENIGDPIQKGRKLPDWMKAIISQSVLEDRTFGYSHSKGLLSTREFLAARNNKLGGVQIEAEDITFFNGLGDAIAKLYQYLLPTARVIGPSPAYSTHSSAEAAHANTHPITYKLDPENQWLPDLDDMYLKVKYNSGIVGILVINPDNPTGMVYPREILERIVEIAEEFDLFLVFDEIYMNLVHQDMGTASMAEVIKEVPGISLKGISKEIPWPGARCGWAEYYNRKWNKEFERLCQTLDNAKMIEVSSTTLPQAIIPKVMGDTRYQVFLDDTNQAISRRGDLLEKSFRDIPHIFFNKTKAAFYSTIIFKADSLNNQQTLKIENEEHRDLVEQWVKGPGVSLDQRFVYYLLAAKGVCVVPVSSFCSDLLGFRITLLEEDEEKLRTILNLVKEGILEYCASA